MLRYIYLKTIALLLRTLSRLTSPITAHPDEIEHIPSRDPNRTIKIHIYHPPPQSPVQTNNQRILLNFSGSGFVMPAHGLDDPFCRRISSTTGYTVFDVSYRTAPEYPFPAALNDAADAVAWTRARYPNARLALSGFSAGGNIAAVTATTTSTTTDTPFSHLMLFYPAVDMRASDPPKTAPDSSARPLLPNWILVFFVRCYMAGFKGEDVPSALADPRVSPGLADPARYPPVCGIVTAAQDTMALDAESLAGRIEEAGKSLVVCERMEGVGHAWDKFVKEETDGEGEEERGIPWVRRERAYGIAVEVLGR
ncbi:alpha/beta-hydrolase [Aspergillus campestris IBT 28561]|uniref:Alpha/beta-hydrolase n=1 Tax=Aspergillus campestris (strain IBT 28561) TaxID=1392248 RepID=A0A2I1DHK4_ASPC2|nr:alpha/beta-hydrolase [Aspergillus campestris IBT 28561]PKY09347.1 alpha/beta-hydrolase [Aspergillus campestris IBT 28561]